MKFWPTKTHDCPGTAEEQPDWRIVLVNGKAALEHCLVMDDHNQISDVVIEWCPWCGVKL